MNVNDFDKFILKYLDGDLNPLELDEFNKIVEENPECKEKLIAHQNIIKELSNIEKITAPKGFSNKLYNEIETISPGFKRRISVQSEQESTNTGKIHSISSLSHYSNYMAYVRVAAGFAIFIFSISIFFNSNETSNSIPNPTLSVEGKTLGMNNDVAHNDQGNEVENIEEELEEINEKLQEHQGVIKTVSDKQTQSY